MTLVMNRTNTAFLMGGMAAISTAALLLFVGTKKNLKIE
ncbi:hypothetical protein PF010_g17673 [Phytophthora fragariae]|uniref:Uncharacterized protein n=2 Tax=Phytophthora TaxID=4783 RepID=A0A6A3R5Y5_9STRA|nr:hypothetical protein PF003_g10554 [Phytophthora fragariae]KAE9318596.1 hypothetical protein PR003_g18192 [Phytophthora rubi]KAE8909982.1 hypothetical protein PF003_g6307 [Phytophthora fragariae]KAE9088227.1 hypothetical protein PF010_g19444 [Phytophthora fragariae]KAE9089816.1 hypothetical protein PF007_g19471 [Phytophthora fragariae]